MRWLVQRVSVTTLSRAKSTNFVDRCGDTVHVVKRQAMALSAAGRLATAGKQGVYSAKPKTVPAELASCGAKGHDGTVRGGLMAFRYVSRQSPESACCLVTPSIERGGRLTATHCPP